MTPCYEDRNLMVMKNRVKPRPRSKRPQRGRPRGGQFSGPTYDQAAKITRLFGGEVALALAIGVSRLTPYRWQYRRPYGTDGMIPRPMIQRIRDAAIHLGIVITDKDWEPSPTKKLREII